MAAVPVFPEGLLPGARSLRWTSGLLGPSLGMLALASFAVQIVHLLQHRAGSATIRPSARPLCGFSTDRMILAHRSISDKATIKADFQLVGLSVRHSLGLVVEGIDDLVGVLFRGV